MKNGKRKRRLEGSEGGKNEMYKKKKNGPKKEQKRINYYYYLLFILTANGFLPGVSGNTISQNTQNNPPRSNKAQHTELHNNKQNYRTMRDTYYTQ
jgi:hypothetical protein